jgi:flavin-dependent dehydrogenase
MGKPEEHWDVLVAGAGPAGSTAARLLAARGVSVLLVDRAVFPRDKVCGCSLNGAAVDALARTGLGGLLDDLGAVPLTNLDLRGFGRQADIQLPGGYALTRRAFDSALVDAAQQAGARFRPGCVARLGQEQVDGWHVELKPTSAESPQTVHARVVLAADGLDGGFLRDHPRFTPVSAPNSKVGLGLFAEFPKAQLGDGEIRMTVGPQGYVGMLRMEDGLVAVAAAVDPKALDKTTPEALIRGILESEGPLPGFVFVSGVRGTPGLTRQRPVRGARRLFLLGDAAGYVEPFTGEGMAWALSSAIRVAPIAEAAGAKWSESLLAEWERFYDGELERRQIACRALRDVLKRPWLAATMIRLVAGVPGLARPVVAGLNRPILEKV